MENGGLQPNFPQNSAQGIWRENKNSLFFPQGPRGELWGKIWVWKPPFSLWFPLAWVAWGPTFPKFIRRTPLQTTQNLATLPFEFSGPLWDEIPKSIGRRRPPKPPRPKVTIGKLEGFWPRFSPELSQWFPLAWVAGAQNSPNLLGGQPKRRPWGKWRVFSPDFPQSAPQGILERTKTFPSLWFPLAWVVWGQNSQNLLGGPHHPRPPKTESLAKNFGENLGWRCPFSPWFSFGLASQ